MKWQTRKEVLAAVGKGRQAALDSVRLHWRNLSTATVSELQEAKDLHLTTVGSYSCALCQLPGDDCRKRQCPAASDEGCCGGAWGPAAAAWNDRDFERFTPLAAKVYEFLEGLEI